jgi:hypothetical protein
MSTVESTICIFAYDDGERLVLAVGIWIGRVDGWVKVKIIALGRKAYVIMDYVKG